jgi:hypothetical protein
MDLTPDQIAQLMQMYRSGGFSQGANIGGQYLAPVGVQGAGEDNGMNTLQGFTGFDPQMIASQLAQSGRIMPNTEGSIYGVNGGYGGSYKTQDDDPDGIQKAVLGAILAASAAGATGMFGGGAGAQSAGMSGMDLAADGGANSLSSAAAGMGGGGAGAGAAGYTMGADALPGVSTMSPSTVAGAASPIGGGGLSSLSSMLPGGMGGLLGPAAALLGAVTGARGQQTQQSSTHDIPEWLKPYVTKQLGYAGGLLDQQMSPGYMAGYDQMRTNAMGLLNQPVAQNGFARFFPGK